MLPESDLKRYSYHYAYRKVGEWLGKDVNSQTSYFAPKNNEPDWNELEQAAHKFYEIVLKELGGNEFIFSRSHRTNKNNEEVVKALNKAGFNVNTSDFRDIIEVARRIRNCTVEATYNNHTGIDQFRHASLNCYDYDRLKKEAKMLAQKIGHNQIELDCPTFSRILAEAAEGEKNDYPGRHLPFNRITGRSAKLYQCLRIMDEILCTSNLPLDNKGMLNLIREKAIEYNIRGKNGPYSKPFEENIKDESFKHYYALLKDLINVEYSTGKRLKYDRSVYESGHFKKHLYKKYKEVEGIHGYKKIQRLSAFTVDISLQEAFRLRKEFGIIRVKYFNDNRIRFAEQFPLISMLGYIEDVVIDVDKHKLLNDLNNTDLKTVNYKSAEYSTLKAKIKDIIASRIPIVLTGQYHTDIVIPQDIKEDGDKWVLVASDLQAKAIRLISPEILSETCEYVSQRSDYSDLTLRHKLSQASKYIIGIGRLIYNEPFDVQIELTEEGTEDINLKKSPLNQLQPEIYKKTIFDDLDRGDIVSFKVYINDDFLKELLQLDITAKLIDIKPTEVKEIYESYFEDYMGVGKTPFSRKRLKRPKAKKEQKQSDTNPLLDTTPPTLE